MLHNWDKRIKILRISTVVIVFVLIMLLLLAGFTIYGNKVGNFIIKVNQDDIKLSLSVDESLNNLTGRLAFSGLDGQNNATYSNIPSNIVEGLGEKNDWYGEHYIAYSFYLINKGSAAIDYDVSLDVVDTVGDPLSILRVLIIEGDGVDKTEGIVYAKPEASEENAAYLRANTDYETVPFKNDIQLIERHEIELMPNVPVKYTIVIWIEGWDVECVDERIDDRVKMELTFTGK